MSVCQFGEVKTGEMLDRNAPQMIEPRSRQAVLTPVVNRGHTRMGVSRHGGRAAHRIDQVVSKTIHDPLNAEMAYLAQGIICHNGICHNGNDWRLVRAMELATIRTLMKERGFNQGDLANLLGLDPSAISKRMTGGRPFKLTEMQRIESWLGAEHAPAIEIGAAVRMVPVIGQVAAGSWREAIQQPLGSRPVPADTPKNVIALRVDGDSMDLEIDDGGTVIVDLDDKALFPGRLFVILNDEGDATFKQFESDPARLEPRSSNPQHRTIQIGDGQVFTVLGRVTALYRTR